MSEEIRPQQEPHFAYALGWNEAIEMVLDVIGDMYNSMNFHNPTLDELEQRIV